MIVQKVIELKENEPNVKIVIFSQWSNILSYIEMAMISTSISYRSKLEKFHQTIQQFKVPLSCALLFSFIHKYGWSDQLLCISLKGSWFECHVPVAAIVIWIQRLKPDWSDACVFDWTHSGSGRRIASYWAHSSNRTNQVHYDIKEMKSFALLFWKRVYFIQIMIVILFEQENLCSSVHHQQYNRRVDLWNGFKG